MDECGKGLPGNITLKCILNLHHSGIIRVSLSNSFFEDVIVIYTSVTETLSVEEYGLFKSNKNSFII